VGRGEGDLNITRISAEFPVVRQIYTRVILHSSSLPSKEFLALSPAITYVGLIDYPTSTIHDLSYLPSSVSHLSIISKNNTTLTLPPSFLPPVLTSLRLPWNFNNLLRKEILPPTLTHIHFGRTFNKPVCL
jgi:hypothetical protein